MLVLAFRCGACGQLLAAEESYRGQQVQCPGCGKSVRVPVQALTLQLPTAVPSTQLLSDDDQASTTQPTPVSLLASSKESLVASTQEAATSEDPVPSQRVSAETVSRSGATIERDGEGLSVSSGVHLSQNESVPSLQAVSALSGAAPAVPETTREAEWPSSAAETSLLDRARVRPQPAVGRRRIPISFWLLAVLLPTTVTFVVISVILFRLWLAELARKERHPLEDLPDTVEGTADVGGRPRTVINPVQRPPEGAAVRLGETRRYDGIEVTPLQVRWQRVIYARTEDGRTRVPASDPMLVLHLRIRNVSDHIIQPFEPIFNAAFREGRAVYTYLSVGDERFYGPLQDVALERLEGQTCIELWPANLKGDEAAEPASLPPSELETIIVAYQSPQRRKIGHALENLPRETSLVWHVHLRKGRQDRLIKGRGYRLWLTTIVPVHFAIKDIVKQTP
ncbi:MAG: hypothetical protein RMI91_07675 [Gemmatales bacterium]|nr:hypothetical protein [Gemmatales bacterium]MDW7994518.1 hypothetical protein [Gemmatales bacterium]